MCQHVFKKWPLKPSEPGALSHGMCLMTASISNCVNSSVRLSKPSEGSIIDSRLKSITGCVVTPILALKVFHMIPALPSCPVPMLPDHWVVEGCSCVYMRLLPWRERILYIHLQNEFCWPCIAFSNTLFCNGGEWLAAPWWYVSSSLLGWTKALSPRECLGRKPLCYSSQSDLWG